MKKSVIAIIATLIVIIVMIVWTLVNNKKIIDSQKKEITKDMVIAVSVAAVEVKTINNTLNIVGTAEANRSVNISSQVTGNITNVNFKLGAYVTKGTVLACTDDKYAQLRVETAQLNYNKLKEDYERYLNLIKGDAVTEAQVREMKLNSENAFIQLEGAKKQLSDTRITAPFDGYITSCNVEIGTHVNVGSTIARIVDISQLKITLSVSEHKVYALRQGQEVDVTASVYPGVNFKGTISHISPQGDSAHTYPVEIHVFNSKENSLKAGTYVNVQIDKEESLSALLIPRNAIVNSIKEPTVYLIDGDKARLKKITIGHDTGIHVEVLSGLKKDDLVVVNGQINLMDGAKVLIYKN